MTNFEPTIDIDQSIPIVYHHARITPKYDCPNWHNNLEILYIRDGRGSVLCGSNTYDAKAGDIFIINPDDIHSVTSKTEMQMTCFIIDNYFCTTNGIPVEKLEFASQIHSEEVNLLCDKLISELESSSDFYSANVRIALLNLMVHLAKKHAQQNPDTRQKNPSNENIRIALGYIKAHFNQNITLDMIAYESGFSKFYFAREFKKLAGMTPVTYINLIRCTEAKKLIKKNKYSIKEISEKCGFFNYSYFAKTFKKHIGILPSEYAKKAK